MKTSSLLCIIAVVATVQSEISLGQGWPILYKLDQPKGKYVLERSYQLPENRSVYEVVIADTFSIELRSGACCVTMSNACVLETKIPNSPVSPGTNAVVQNKMLFKAYGIAFPSSSKCIFNGSVTELRKLDVDGSADEKFIYEGDDALRRLKQLGLEPPDHSDDKRQQEP
jgi:hypothetical protein